MDNYILGLDAKDNATPKIEKFGKKLKEVEGKFSGFGGKLGNALKELPAAGSMIGALAGGPITAAAAAIVAVGAAIVGVVTKTIDFADNMNDMSIKLGISTEKLSVLKLYADQSGTSIDELSNNMVKLGARVANGDSDLKKYGVTASSTDEALYQLADKIQKTEDPMMRLKIATDAFGKSGQDMLPLLVQGGDALRTMSQEAPIVSTELAKMADEFNDKMTVLKGSFTNLGITVTTEFLPSLIQAVGFAEKIAVAIGGGPKAAALGVSEWQDKIKELKTQLEDPYLSMWQKTKLKSQLKEAEIFAQNYALTELEQKVGKDKGGSVAGYRGESLTKPKPTTYKSEEDIKAEKKAADEKRKEREKEAERIKKEKEKEGAENLKALQDEWKKEGNAKVASDFDTQKKLEAALTEKENKEKEQKIKVADELKQKEDQDLADKQAKYREFANAAASNISQPLNTFFDDITSGNQSIFDSFDDLFGNIADGFKNMLFQMASEMLAKAAIFGLLNLITGGGAAGLLGGGGGGGGMFGLPGFAQGTNYAPGGLALVGEEGPELVNLPRGSKVTPNNKSLTNQLTINLNGTNFSEKDVIRIATEANRKINRDAKWRGKN